MLPFVPITPGSDLPSLQLLIVEGDGEVDGLWLFSAGLPAGASLERPRKSTWESEFVWWSGLNTAQVAQQIYLPLQTFAHSQT